MKQMLLLHYNVREYYLLENVPFVRWK